MRLGMTKLFLDSRARGECERCGKWFDPVKGGVCPQCGQILCGNDLYGSLAMRLLGYSGFAVRCRSCRAQRAAPPESVGGQPHHSGGDR